jgi:hypothetical protein
MKTSFARWLEGHGYREAALAWERTSVTNWQIDGLDAYSYSPALTDVGSMTWLAQDNPSYNVRLLAASIAFKW